MQMGIWNCLVSRRLQCCESRKDRVDDGLDENDEEVGAGRIRVNQNARTAMGVNASHNNGCADGGPIPGGMAMSTGPSDPNHHASANNSCGFFVREQRRKKVTGFATLRKKFIRRRRSSKACDHGRILRDFVSDWSPSEVASLLEEYEALAALKDLSVQAELARPPATTYKQDLAALYDYKYVTDCDLVFRGGVFPVHRALLSARCPYFRDLLSGCPGSGARICLELRTSPVDLPIFSSLLRYLYTGDLCPFDTALDAKILRRLGDDFGTPNLLEHDLRYLLETGDYADTALIFTAEGTDCHRPDSGSSEYGFRPKLELPCHRAILSARSPFFRNLITRRARQTLEAATIIEAGAAADRPQVHVPTRIVLDETVIPKRYAKVLLHAIYLDTVDLTLILRGNGCGNSAGSLGEVQALTHTGRTRPTPLEEAMELYQIGRFLELNILSQGCEDLILEWLTLDTLAQVLKWGQQPHGSAWVHRQACHYLREEFSAVVSSPVLHQLEKQQLFGALQSNFLQASELEVLQAVLKWGETELMRRMEDREPNLLSHTAHSVTRKGIKKRDLSDVELREILSELLPLVRMDHVLPPNSEHLNQAIRRGLVSTPPSHMIGDERDNLRINAWVRCGKMHGLFVRPRLFMPYYEEIKTLLEDRVHQTDAMRQQRRSRQMPDIPDTLYMVSRLGGSHRDSDGSQGGSRNSMSMMRNCRANGDGGGVGGCSSAELGNHMTAGLDIVAGSLPAPDPAEMRAMAKREQKLRISASCQRALALPLSSRNEINLQIRLRVVREFNLPDDVADLLENTSCLCLDDDTAAAGSASECFSGGAGASGTSYGGDLPPQNTLPYTMNCRKDTGQESVQPMEDDVTPPPSPALQSNRAVHGMAAGFGCNQTFPRQQSTPFMVGSSGGVGGHLLGRPAVRRQDLSSNNLADDGGFRAECTGGGIAAYLDATAATQQSHLSQVMPDVAMATASLEQLQLHNDEADTHELNLIERERERRRRRRPLESLQLDLGDGSPHVLMQQQHRPMGNLHTLPPNLVQPSLTPMATYQQVVDANGVPSYIRRSVSPSFAIMQQQQQQQQQQNQMQQQQTHRQSPAPPNTSYHSGPPRFL